MSNGWSVRALGKPYFMFVQEQLAYMDAASWSSQPGQIRLEFAVDSLPEVNASVDEIHPLFSVHEYGYGGQELLALGITPSGKIAAMTPGGGTFFTDSGLVTPNGAMQSILMIYSTDGVNGLGRIYLLPGTGQVTIGSSNALPLASSKPGTSFVGQVMLGNGLSGLSKFRYRIREARLIFGASLLPAFTDQLLWAIDEGGGGLLHGSVIPATSGHNATLDLIDLTLRAKPWTYPYNFFTSPPWGSTPPTTDDLSAYYEWVVSTAYARIANPITRYTRTLA